MGSSCASHDSVRFSCRILSSFTLFVLLTSGALLAQTPNDPQQLLKEAISLHQAGKLDEAIADYRALLEKYPNVSEVRSDLGAALAATGQYKEAIEEYERALKIQPMPQVQLNLGLAYYKSAQLRPALQAFQKAQQQMPGDSKPILLQADCYLRLGENKKVIQLLSPFAQQSGNDLAVTYMLGTALVRDGQSDTGQVLIDKILRMWTEGPTLTVEEVAGILAPTLVMVGDDDMPTLSHTVSMYEALPHGQLAVVPGASHAVPMEKAPLVNQLILEFLQTGEPQTMIPIRRQAQH